MKNLNRSALGLSFFIALLCLQGCGVVTKQDIDKAERLCEPNGGLKHIYVRNVEVECNNGATFTWEGA